MTAAPDPALVERFRSDLEALTGEVPTPGRKLGVAVSGGPDSLALLLLAAAAYPGAIEAATVDHGLRAEAADEAAFVHRLCVELAVPHAILTRPDGLRIEGSGQDYARGLRYVLLGFWSGSGTFADAPPWRTQWVATAHHRDDVAESFLMRARRGAGVGGLAAMRQSRPLAAFGAAQRLLLRPLLRWSRAELAQLVAAAGLEPVDDPSNRDSHYDRARIRALLAATPELPPQRLARAAENLRHAEDALGWAVAREWAARARVEDYATVWLDPAGLPYELRRRLVLRAIDTVRFEFDIPGEVREERVDRLLATLDGGGVGTMAGVRAAARKGLWRFALAPARRSH